MRTKRVAEFFSKPLIALPGYRRYWGRLGAVTAPDAFKRWLFAFCSVHTSWKGTLRGYLAVRDFRPWAWTRADLESRLRASGAGLHNHRADYIWRFARDYWSNPDPFRKWTERDALVERVKGLGDAKVSFALNMIHPLDSRVVCLDVHMLRLYAVSQEKCNHKIYRRVESDWLGRCGATPPFLAHSIYWDGVQGQTDSSYWAHVL